MNSRDITPQISETPQKSKRTTLASIPNLAKAATHRCKVHTNTVRDLLCSFSPDIATRTATTGTPQRLNNTEMRTAMYPSHNTTQTTAPQQPQPRLGTPQMLQPQRRPQQYMAHQQQQQATHKWQQQQGHQPPQPITYLTPVTRSSYISPPLPGANGGVAHTSPYLHQSMT